MDIAERVKDIIVQPKTAWEKIKGEAATVKEVYLSYAAVLAVIPAAASFIGMTLVGVSATNIHYRIPVSHGLINAALQYLLSLAGMYVMALIIDALAPRFNSKKDLVAATKVAVFSWTPALAAGVLGVIPALSPLILLASLYSLYVMYIGLPVLMETPKEKSTAYFAVVIVISIAAWVAASFCAALVIRMPSMGMMP
ncbi:MAG: YIP1 family protein [Chitinispirillaceae bacterium]|nr:YIP1 family protein [Chitinispirillaceae bacterium]